MIRLVQAVDERQVALGEALLAGQSELRQHDKAVLLISAEMFGHEQFGSERPQAFVHRHARRIGGEFEQRSAGLADIERIEIFAVMGVDFTGILGLELHAQGLDRILASGAKGDMVDRAGAGRRRPEAAGIAHIDDIAGI